MTWESDSRQMNLEQGGVQNLNMAPGHNVAEDTLQSGRRVRKRIQYESSSEEDHSDDSDDSRANDNDYDPQQDSDQYDDEEELNSDQYDDDEELNYGLGDLDDGSDEDEGEKEFEDEDDKEHTNNDEKDDEESISDGEKEGRNDDKEDKNDKEKDDEKSDEDSKSNKEKKGDKDDEEGKNDEEKDDEKSDEYGSRDEEKKGNEDDEEGKKDKGKDDEKSSIDEEKKRDGGYRGRLHPWMQSEHYKYEGEKHTFKGHKVQKRVPVRNTRKHYTTSINVCEVKDWTSRRMQATVSRKLRDLQYGTHLQADEDSKMPKCHFGLFALDNLQLQPEMPDKSSAREGGPKLVLQVAPNFDVACLANNLMKMATDLLAGKKKGDSWEVTDSPIGFFTSLFGPSTPNHQFYQGKEDVCDGKARIYGPGYNYKENSIEADLPGWGNDVPPP